jgi:predicted RNase H-like HicB family nuclease
MKTLIEVHKDGNYVVAIDLLSNIADQGLTEKEALSNLTRGLEEHYRLLIELTPAGHMLKYLDIEVENAVRSSTAFIP